MTKQKNTKTSVNEKEAVRALEYLLAAGYVDKKKLYFTNFVRGIFFSLGSVIGATIVIALVAWILSLFDQVPFIGEIIQKVQSSLNSAN